jgi:fido (protein-threonine AMPylation protein)
MKEKSRYDASNMIDAQIEPGSGGRVLKNLLGIKRKREMDQIEGREQRRALDELIRIYEKDHRFTATDIRRIHQLWLGNVYEWAGEYRQVGSGNFVNTVLKEAEEKTTRQLKLRRSGKTIEKIIEGESPSGNDSQTWSQRVGLINGGDSTTRRSDDIQHSQDG